MLVYIIKELFILRKINVNSNSDTRKAQEILHVFLFMDGKISQEYFATSFLIAFENVNNRFALTPKFKILKDFIFNKNNFTENTENAICNKQISEQNNLISINTETYIN